MIPPAGSKIYPRERGLFMFDANQPPNPLIRGNTPGNSSGKSPSPDTSRQGRERDQEYSNKSPLPWGESVRVRGGLGGEK